jgi:NADH:ubiquinone oxidoreductase subunit 6 (subunit J)
VDFGETHEEIPCSQFGFVEFAVVDHIDDRIGCGGEFIGVIVAKGVTAEIAVSMVVVVMMVGGGGESLGGGLKEDIALGTLILLEAAALVFLSATTVARIVASDLEFGHCGSILPSWSEDVDQTIEEILRDTRFYELLLGFDRQIADTAHADRCPKCGAALHWGSWERKPRGGPAGLDPRHRLRFSLCCAADGCRKRETPGSLRFLGRKVFFGAIVVLISAMQSGLNPTRMRRLKELVGVSRRTVLRWRDWWHTVFTMSPFWRAHGALAPAANTADLPASLLQSFDGTTERQLISLLRFLVPITTGRGILQAI